LEQPLPAGFVAFRQGAPRQQIPAPRNLRGRCLTALVHLRPAPADSLRDRSHAALGLDAAHPGRPGVLPGGGNGEADPPPGQAFRRSPRCAGRSRPGPNRATTVTESSWHIVGPGNLARSRLSAGRILVNAASWSACLKTATFNGVAA